MAPFATVLCIGFIAVLLTAEVRRRRLVSAATWIPTLVVFTISSRTPAQWLGVGVANNPLDRAWFACLILVSLMTLCRRRVQWGRVVMTNRVLLLFYGYFALSAVWSFYPAQSLVRVLKDFGLTVIVALVLLSEKRASDAIRAVYVRCACVAFPLSLLYTKYYDVGKGRDTAGNVLYSGISTQKNSFGGLVMVYMFFVAYDYVESRFGVGDRLWSRRWWGHSALLVIGAWLLVLSQSKTALVGAVLSCALLAARKKWETSRRASAAVVGAAMCFPLLMIFAQEFTWVLGPVVSVLGRDASLSGRTDIWRMIDASTANPWIGSGFWNFWETPEGLVLSEALVGEPGKPTPQAHNGFLEVYLDGGIIGVVVLAILMLTAARQILRSLPRQGLQVVRFIFLVVALVSNTTEALFARPSAIWSTTVLVLLNYPSSRTAGARAMGGIARKRLGASGTVLGKWMKVSSE